MNELNKIDQLLPEVRDKHRDKALKIIGAQSRPVGGRGIIVSVIALGVTDLFSEDDGIRQDAYEYFGNRGGMFQEHLSRLDLPTDWLPAVFEE